MKKLASIALVAIVATFTLTSCKKDYTCTCNDPIFGTTIQTIPNSSKDDAETFCDNLNAATVALGGSCTLTD